MATEQTTQSLIVLFCKTHQETHHFLSLLTAHYSYFLASEFSYVHKV